MAQSEIQVTTTPPLPGTQLVQEVNDALETIATDFSGTDDPASDAFPYSLWADTATGFLKRRNAANSVWEIISRIFPSLYEDENGNVDIDGDLDVTGDLNATTAAVTSLTVGGSAISPQTGFRNRIINGDMRIDQRNAGAAVTANGSYPVDRFLIGNGTDGAFSAQRDTVAPVGFINSLKVTTTTADATLTTTQGLLLAQYIEGLNVSDLAWGTASAQPITLSFWVRSSLTGTFGGSIQNSALDRSYPFTYTISAANTFEYKTITVAGDTTGTWLTTSGIGLRLWLGLGVGPDRSGTAGAWAGADYRSATGAVSVVGTLNATFYITGVQLEKGSTATPFEFRSIGQELALCQRYYQVARSVVQSASTITSYLKVSMRAAPTVTGGGAGFTVSFAETETFGCFQTSNAQQVLVASSEL